MPIKVQPQPPSSEGPYRNELNPENISTADTRFLAKVRETSDKTRHQAPCTFELKKLDMEQTTVTQLHMGIRKIVEFKTFQTLKTHGTTMLKMIPITMKTDSNQKLDLFFYIPKNLFPQ